MITKSVDAQIAESECFGKGYNHAMRECLICEAKKGCAIAYSHYINQDEHSIYIDSRQTHLYENDLDIFKIEDVETGEEIKKPKYYRKKDKSEKPTIKTERKKPSSHNTISYPEDMPNYTRLSMDELKSLCDKIGIEYTDTWQKMNLVTALRKAYIRSHRND